MKRAWLTASAVAILFSIAAYNILFAASLVALLLSKAPLRVPRIWLPVDEFPRTSSGKVKKYDLVELLPPRTAR